MGVSQITTAGLTSLANAIANKTPWVLSSINFGDEIITSYTTAELQALTNCVSSTGSPVFTATTLQFPNCISVMPFAVVNTYPSILISVLMDESMPPTVGGAQQQFTAGNLMLFDSNNNPCVIYAMDAVEFKYGPLPLGTNGPIPNRIVKQIILNINSQATPNDFRVTIAPTSNLAEVSLLTNLPTPASSQFNVYLISSSSNNFNLPVLAANYNGAWYYANFMPNPTPLAIQYGGTNAETAPLALANLGGAALAGNLGQYFNASYFIASATSNGLVFSGSTGSFNMTSANGYITVPASGGLYLQDPSSNPIPIHAYYAEVSVNQGYKFNGSAGYYGMSATNGVVVVPASGGLYVQDQNGVYSTVLCGPGTNANGALILSQFTYTSNSAGQVISIPSANGTVYIQTGTFLVTATGTGTTQAIANLPVKFPTQCDWVGAGWAGNAPPSTGNVTGMVYGSSTTQIEISTYTNAGSFLTWFIAIGN